MVKFGFLPFVSDMVLYAHATPRKLGDARRVWDKPCVCWVFVAPPADGWDQDFWLAFSPHLAIFEGGLDGFDPLEKQGL